MTFAPLNTTDRFAALFGDTRGAGPDTPRPAAAVTDDEVLVQRMTQRWLTVDPQSGAAALPRLWGQLGVGREMTANELQAVASGVAQTAWARCSDSTLDCEVLTWTARVVAVATDSLRAGARAAAVSAALGTDTWHDIAQAQRGGRGGAPTPPVGATCVKCSVRPARRVVGAAGEAPGR